MKRFCLFDVSNLVYRAAFGGGTHRSGGPSDEDDATNLALATAIRSMRVPFNRFKATHSVMCFDSYSWRKEILDGYKSSRAARSESDQNLYQGIRLVIDEFRGFLIGNSNSTVLWKNMCEADDLIARFIALHPDDEHVIVSSDSDFKQLISPKVSLYNATSGILISDDGVYKNDGTKIKRGTPTKVIHGDEWEVVMDKDGKPERIDPKWLLFRKIMDGDSSDDVPPTKPPRMKTKLLEEAYRFRGGAAWNDLMATKRIDLDGSPTVAELYDLHSLLIDLSQIPDPIKDEADYHIAEEIGKPQKSGLGMKFMVFCRDRRMVNLGKDADRYVPMLAQGYAHT